jgi:hypothetical protein
MVKGGVLTEEEQGRPGHLEAGRENMVTGCRLRQFMEPMQHGLAIRLELIDEQPRLALRRLLADPPKNKNKTKNIACMRKEETGARFMALLPE